ncbi:MAG: DNA repair protein RecN [Zetaproteobacteria bacterium]|nr:MAG: DNA repair protein RecN [Zetaproteobacteria bacterium]
MEQAFRRWQSLKEKLNCLRQQKNKAVEQAEWMRHELEQLKALAPRAGLAEQLEDTVEKGRRHAQLQQAAAQALAMLDEAEPNARFLMGQAMHALRAMSDYDDDLARAYELVVQADALLEEAAPSLRLVRDTEFDEETLQADEERRMALHEAMRRHQTDEEGLIRLMERLESDLSLAETADWEESRLEEELHEAERAYLALANQLHEQRMQAADKLMHLMRPHLDALALQGMQVRFHILAQPSPEHWTTHGFDRIHLEVMANPGEPWRALNTTISGGELSRFVLALKGCHAMQNAPPIAVFDEVDTGVGGEIGWHIGRVLSAMGQTRQVLVISHLPQVAACADHHVHIEKQTQDQRTVSRLRVLNADERVDELARMLGGGDARALEHAHAMLRAARAT